MITLISKHSRIYYRAYLGTPGSSTLRITVTFYSLSRKIQGNYVLTGSTAPEVLLNAARVHQERLEFLRPHSLRLDREWTASHNIEHSLVTVSRHSQLTSSYQICAMLLSIAI
jgi:hypothetical protein